MIEQAEFYNKLWYKIVGDDAFQYVIGDWYQGYSSTYYRYVKDYNVVVQAGGYCGIYPRLFAEKFNSVYTFEPDPLNFLCLTLNCDRDNIIKFQSALGDKHEMVLLNRLCLTNKGMNVVRPYTNASIPTLLIDDLDLSDCNFIQLDTEGYELKILKGAARTIEKFKPVIAVEDSNDNIKSYLSTFGYEERETINRDTIFSRG